MGEGFGEGLDSTTKFLSIEKYVHFIEKTGSVSKQTQGWMKSFE